jgi:ribosomal-protein-alanine N-acetyltransferase
MREFIIRNFEPKDLEHVVKINWTTLPEHYDNSFFLNIYSQFPRSFLVAQIGEKVVGYIMCRVEVGFSERRRLHITRKGHVVSIAVLPEYRRRGIASALMGKALEALKDYHVSETYLEVRVSNSAAISLYKKFGFSTVREVAGYYRDGENACVMVRNMEN